MSYAQFLGQNVPYYSTDKLNLSLNNFITYSITPSLTQNIDVSSNTNQPVIVRTFVPPVGVWSWSMTFIIQDKSADNIIGYVINVGNNLPLPSDNGVEQITRSSTNAYPNSPTVFGNLSGICYSDGITPFNIKLAITLLAEPTATWVCYQEAITLYGVAPSIQFARLSCV